MHGVIFCLNKTERKKRSASHTYTHPPPHILTYMHPHMHPPSHKLWHKHGNGLTQHCAATFFIVSCHGLQFYVFIFLFLQTLKSILWQSMHAHIYAVFCAGRHNCNQSQCMKVGSGHSTNKKSCVVKECPSPPSCPGIFCFVMQGYIICAIWLVCKIQFIQKMFLTPEFIFIYREREKEREDTHME